LNVEETKTIEPSMADWSNFLHENCGNYLYARIIFSIFCNGLVNFVSSTCVINID